MRATRAEVARLAGVSPAVVSYVLNGGPRNVAPETRRRVEEAIASLEYRPNAIAQALRGGRSGAVGVVVGPGGEDLFSALTPALQDAAIEFGYAMYVSFAADVSRERTDARSLVDRQVDALIAVNPADLSAFVDLQTDGTPVAVVADQDAADVSVSLNIDPVAAHRALAEHVALLGVHTIIASSLLPNRDPGAEADSSYRSLEFGSAQGGAELLQILADPAGTACMCATDAELDRILWLAESSGLERTEGFFTSSRIDLREQPDADADLMIAWDLRARVRTVLGDLIKQSDDPTARFPPEHVAWTVRSRESASKSMAWGVQDL